MSGKEYLKMIEDFKSTRGFEVYSLTQSIDISFETFSGNQKELFGKLQEHGNSSSLQKFDGYKKRSKLECEFREIIRLLHNFAASAMSLVEHTRRIARKLLKDNYLKMYQNKIDIVFKEDCLTGFIQDLRNYLLHFSHPPVKRTIRFESTHIKSVGIELSVVELNKWDGWSKRSAKFFKTQGDDIVLDEVVKEYSIKIADFLNWLDDHIKLACKPELDELWKKHDEWGEFCKKHKIPTTEDEY